MDATVDPELRRRWEAVVRTYLDQRPKLIRSRQRLRQAHEALAREARTVKDPLRRQYVALSLRQLELLLRQLEVYNLDSNVIRPIEATEMLAGELRTLEIQALSLRIDQLNLTRFQALLDSDLAGALADAPPPDGLPNEWLALRPHFQEDAAWTEALTRFQEGFPAFSAGVDVLAAATDELEKLPPGQERLKRMRALGLPALRGEVYRLQAPFRLLAGGEQLLAGVAVGPAPEAASSAPRPLTDRLKGLFGRTRGTADA